MPAVYLLIARSIMILPIKPIFKLILPVVIVMLFTGHNFLIRKYYTEPYKQQFREAIQFVVAQNDITSKKALVIYYAWNGAYLDYYFQQQNSDYRAQYRLGAKGDIGALTTLLAEKEPQYVWFISAHLIPDPAFIAYLNKRFSIVKAIQFKGASVSLFENK